MKLIVLGDDTVVRERDDVADEAVPLGERHIEWLFGICIEKHYDLPINCQSRPPELAGKKHCDEKESGRLADKLYRRSVQVVTCKIEFRIYDSHR